MRKHSVIHTPKLSDYVELARIWEASVRATHDFLPDSYIMLLKNLVLTRYLDAVMLICTRDLRQRITGFAGVAAGKVEMLFIDPQHRGQGLGRQLLFYAIEHMNADELDVNEQNPQALGFYFKQGFEVIGRTEHDGLGQPYPLLHMRLRTSVGDDLPAMQAPRSFSRSQSMQSQAGPLPQKPPALKWVRD